MNNCIQDYLTIIIFTTIVMGGSIITNCMLCYRIYALKKKNNIKEEPSGIEMIKLEPTNQLEDYVMRIGDGREVVKGDLPEWVISDYKNRNK